MNKKYNENRIQELLKTASKNIAPESSSFDVLLSRLDTSVVKETIYTKPVVSPFSFFKFAGVFTAFIFVLLGVRNISSPLQDSATPSGPLATSVGVEGAGLTETRVIATNAGVRTSSDNIAGRAMSASFAKSIEESPEVSALESAALSSLASESNADSELLALSPGI